MTRTICIVFCPNHGEKLVCVGVLLDNVAHINVPDDLRRELLQSPNATVHYQLCSECQAKGPRR